MRCRSSSTRVPAAYTPLFNQAVTATGRLSSSNPNLQNIPVRGEDGREIRKAFVPDDGCTFFSADYSQIELRIMAHLSGDEHMIADFNAGHDIHAATAARIFHKPIEEVSRDERRKAKTANFGIIYGISAFGLSERLSIPRGEAKDLIDSYFETYPKVKEYMNTCIDRAKERGYILTEFKRRRYLPDINSRNATVRGYAERNAVNAPIQGTAADIIKVAMVAIDRRLREEQLQTKMILQVHDELNFSIPNANSTPFVTLWSKKWNVLSACGCRCSPNAVTAPIGSRHTDPLRTNSSAHALLTCEKLRSASCISARVRHIMAPKRLFTTVLGLFSAPTRVIAHDKSLTL